MAVYYTPDGRPVYTPQVGSGPNTSAKTSRGVDIGRSNPNPGFGDMIAYDQSMSPTSFNDPHLRTSGLPPANFGTPSHSYVPDNRYIARNMVGDGFSDPLTAIQTVAPTTGTSFGTRPVDEFGFYTDAPPVPGSRTVTGPLAPMTADPVLADADPWTGLRTGPAAPKTGLRTGGSRPIAKARTPISPKNAGGIEGLLSMMFGGGGGMGSFGQSRPQMEEGLRARGGANVRAAQGTNRKPITYDYKPVKSAGERTDVMGNDMAFQPLSVQMSSRWNTGY